MKNLFFLILCITTIVSCKKNEPNVVKEPTTVIEPKSPLNKLKYASKIDFYCKMDLAKYGVSDTVSYNGQLYGFCSTMCKDEFLMKPEEYLAKK